jgi:FtsP/CotA-like multicopper oxidase with cupredoxin domain
MAGALIVEGDINRIPAVARARERIFVFQQLAFDKDGEIKSIEHLNSNWTGKEPQNGPKKHTSINGVVKPLIVMRPGQVERWRMIDAGVFEFLDLSLRKKDDPGPGHRADALVQAPLTPGIYELYKSKPTFNLLAFATEQESRLAGKPEILAEIKVEPGTCTAPYSTAILARVPRFRAPPQYERRAAPLPHSRQPLPDGERRRYAGRVARHDHRPTGRRAPDAHEDRALRREVRPPLPHPPS